ncbi:class I SAM-dependent methyltransferase [Roseofilum casamattae]|uniref:Class I SAM-dependent methyltransferase n=1 Tax=Roseofilum casamattae BLCC-M143 TaxID=3022442 RepID=A0ABT7BXI2_9CYAN|nr:class I SAM-dependent methyltransferase [Roseofilum casamattae]MDJ1183903.1 class I SAM-dependent methyltransferase [Roseofilum casamattae BLCC-M143]
MDNQYTNITEYYDLWVTSGYYNYPFMAKEACNIVGGGRNIIELGVGTGLLVEEYLKIDPSCQFTGVDFTASLLEIGAKRLGDRVQLIEADVVSMDLNATFDVAISNGGVWGILDLGDRWQFGGHVPGVEANRKGLENLARHLQTGALLLLHLQKPHQDFDKVLPGDIVYSQSIETQEETPEYYSFKKRYFFKKDDKVLATEEILVTCFNPELSQNLLSDAGFELQDFPDAEYFAVYKKQ